ncbi:hypothetical protein EIP86_003838 [Pleurotus ostreatoroseus]|nr:hypothetical protein EIP86_003838 [Pleurotus ostreatoroseus]
MVQTDIQPVESLPEPVTDQLAPGPDSAGEDDMSRKALEDLYDAAKFTEDDNDLGFLTGREGVRLRELRYKALHRWRVPEIVNLVSMLLQAALVLFLTGVWLNLEVLNNTVFLPYATFVAVSFAFLASTIALSMIRPACAYKSALSYALSIIVKTGVMSLYYCVVFVVLVVTKAVQCLLSVYHGPLLRSQMLRVDMALSSTYAKIGKAMADLPLDYTATANEYWLLRERALLEKDDSTAEDLDSRALSWVLPWLPENKLDDLKSCLNGLVDSGLKLQVVAAWITQRFNIPIRLKYAVTDSSGPIARSSQINDHFATHYSHILLDALPDSWHDGRRSAEHQPFRVPILIVLREISKKCRTLEDSFKTNYTKKVMALRGCQTSVAADQVNQLELPELRLPTVALFECSTVFKYDFEDEDLEKLLRWADDAFKMNKSISPTLGAPRVWINALEIIVASTATVADAIARRVTARPGETIDSGFLTRYLEQLKQLDELVEAEPACISTFALHGRGWLGQGVSSVIVHALNRIGESVLELVDNGLIDLYHASHMRDHISRLCELFADEPLFQATFAKLQTTLDARKEEAPSTHSAKDDPTTPGVTYNEPLSYSATPTLRVTETPRR